jgi:predicted nucleotidyltransferase
LTTQIAELLRALHRARVEYVVVGSAAAILHGAGYTTEDLDVVVNYSEENLARLLDLLDDLDAVYLDLAQRTIRPDAERLRTNRLNLLRTRHGRLDVLRAIEPERTYPELLSRSTILEVEGLPIRTVNLETLIESKEHADRDKDRLHLVYLRETLRLRRLKDESER